MHKANTPTEKPTRVGIHLHKEASVSCLGSNFPASSLEAGGHGDKATEPPLNFGAKF